MIARRLGCFAVCVWVAVGASPTAAVAFSFSVNPTRIELAVPAGKQRGKAVRLDNTRSDTSVHIKVYVQDVLFLPDGTGNFPAPGTTDWSCASWIQVVPQELDIPPGQSQQVRLSVAVPSGTLGGHYAMVFFESSPSYVERGVGVNFRIGSLVQVTVPGTEVYQAKLADFLVDGSKARLHLFNDGNLLIRPQGKIKVFSLDGRQQKKVAQLPFNPTGLGVLPKTLRVFTVPLDTLPIGQYHLRAEIDYGTRYLLVGERDVERK